MPWADARPAQSSIATAATANRRHTLLLVMSPPSKGCWKSASTDEARETTKERPRTFFGVSRSRYPPPFARCGYGLKLARSKRGATTRGVGDDLKVLTWLGLRRPVRRILLLVGADSGFPNEAVHDLG